MVEVGSAAALKNTVVVDPERLKLQKALCAGRTVIGIDISYTSVSVAQTAMYRGKPTLIKTAIRNIVIADEGQSAGAALAALKRVLADFNTRRADIICVLLGRQSLVENIVMPVMPLGDLADAVRLEVLNSQHFSIKNPVVDFKVLGRVLDKGVEKMNVMVTAAAKSSVDDLLAKFILQQGKPLAGDEAGRADVTPVGLNVSAIIPLALAMENIIKKSKLRVEETIAVLEMGTIGTELNFYRNSRLEFSRQITVTGSDLTRSLTRAMFTNIGKIELTLEEAEQIKRDYGLPSPEDNFIINGKISAAQILALLRPRLEQFVGEISRSFDYYRDKMHVGNVDRLIVFGGGARLKGLPGYLNAELGLPVNLGNPLKDIELLYDGVVRNEEEAHKLVLAIGASLGDLHGINLLPSHLKERKEIFVRKIAVGLVAAVVILVSGVVYYGLAAERDANRARLAVSRSEYEGLLPQVEKFKDELKVKMLARARPDISVFLKQLSYLPRNVFLSEINLDGGKVTLSGMVVGEGRDAQEAPAQLVLELNKNILSSVRLFPSQKMPKTSNVTQFQIEGRVVAEEGKK